MNLNLRALYAVLTDEDVSAIEQHMQWRAVSRGEVLIAESAVSDALHLIQRGQARVLKAHLGAQVPIAELDEGEVFGEISFLLRDPATASVVMDSDGEVMSIGGDALRALVAARPGMEARLYHSLAQLLAQRLSKTSRVTLPSFVGG